MKFPKIRLILLLAISLLGAVLAFWLGDPSHLGSLEARVDLFRGKVEIRGGGLQGTMPGYHELLQQRYGVVIRNYGCVVTARDEYYWAGYNGVVTKYLQHRYGADVLGRTFMEVVQKHGNKS